MENTDQSLASTSPLPASSAPLISSPEIQEPKTRPIALLAAALARAQGKFQTPKKTRKVDFSDNKGRRVNYSYADLSDLIDAVRAPLSENELSLTHILAYTSRGGFGMTTSLIHSSGERLSTWYPLPDPQDGVNPKEFASLITYGRRYSASCLLGIASEEDEDGGEARPPAEGLGLKPHESDSWAAGAPTTVQGAATPSTQGPKPSGAPLVKPLERPMDHTEPPARGPSAAWIKFLWQKSDERKWTNEQVHLYIAQKWGIESVKALTADWSKDLIRVIESQTFQQAMFEFVK